jgi:hypothetical protein
MTSAQTQVPSANFAKMLNVPTGFKVTTLNSAAPTAVPVPYSPPFATTQATPVVVEPEVKPVALASILDSIKLNENDLVSEIKKESRDTIQEQQQKHAGFTFKVSRVKNVLVDATVDERLKSTLKRLEAEKNKNGVGAVPLDQFSDEDRAVIETARLSYNEMLAFRNKEGKEQFVKELKAWNEMKVLDVDGKDTGVLVKAYNKILRDVFTLDFKSNAELNTVHGVIDSKDATKNTGIRAWIKSHKKDNDHLSIRPQCVDKTRLVVEVTYNQQNPAASEALVKEFSEWLVANASSANISYQRVTAEYKKKMVKNKNTEKYVEQEKKKPTEAKTDALDKKDPYSAAIYMVSRLLNRFSEEVSIAMTVFIDYLVRQFSKVAIVKCREENKSRVHVHHVIKGIKEIELFPVVAHFEGLFDALLSAANGQKTTKAPKGAVAETKTDNDKKHVFEFCISGVCDQIRRELQEEDEKNGNNKGYKKILISLEFKNFMCNLVDQLIMTIGPIFRMSIENNNLKTVNINTFYDVLGVLLGWYSVKYDVKDANGERQGVRAYIEERVRRYKGYVKADGEEVQGYVDFRANERALDRKKGKNPGTD